MITLIDGDLITYRCAASAENDPVEAAIERCRDLMHRICEDTQATTYELYINGSENFRYAIDPMYKAHRKDVAKPKHLEACREYLITDHKAHMSAGVETDDEIGMLATGLWEVGAPFVVASLDKDLLQLPGTHYNFVKNVFTQVSPLQGTQTFYRQMLIGDRADNITGVQGIGEVKAGKAINCLDDEADMYDTVRAMYDTQERFERNAQLLWILKHERNPNEVISHFRTSVKPEAGTKQ
jgi:5'-3' exonuclease